MLIQALEVRILLHVQNGPPQRLRHRFHLFQPQQLFLRFQPLRLHVQFPQQDDFPNDLLLHGHHAHGHPRVRGHHGRHVLLREILLIRFLLFQ